VAWFRMMGVQSVEYHRQTVVGRADDHAGAALAYYGSRGETPMEWGGKLAGRLGLDGVVDDESYTAIFGPGGAVDPHLGTPLVRTSRPGIELVVAAHKSVAVLGVIGRPEDMHQILDAETAATMSYLESWFERQGGRRGRQQQRTATGGLLWAQSRHATSRAGDPAPHDHVLVANLTEMLDTRGGWKALDTALLRDLVHAATMAGRIAGAATAVELGYVIERDDGPSGKLGHWRIAGIPKDVCAVLSKRSDEIELAMESQGFGSYRARQVATRATRAPKTEESPAELLPRWRAEVAAAGWSVEALQRQLDETNSDHRRHPKRITPAQLTVMASAALAADGPLAESKAFTRAHVMRVVAPALFGQPVEVLDEAVAAVVAHRDAIPLVGQRGARQRAWVTASVLAAEAAIAAVAQRLATSPAAAVPADVVDGCLRVKEQALGAPLAAGQRAAAIGVCTGGGGLDVIVGVAGAGKTTALDVVRSAFEAAGCRVLGSATSGQAARSLEQGAGVESRTVASLLWRLNSGQITFDERTVLVLDAAGMTDDRPLLSLLAAAEAAHSKVVLVGDHRQLDAVLSGGGLEGIVSRHGSVHVLTENVRQQDPGERHALGRLRDGNAGAAVGWYRDNDRLRIASTREQAIDAAVGGWLDDQHTGKETLLLAWRRTDVASLNAAARDAWAGAGRLDGPELAHGGRCYARGDRVVALAPTADRSMVTSERGTVTAFDLDNCSILVRTDRGLMIRLTGEELGAARLDHAYAVTVHRAQGATVDRAHVLADGGGRELAYVAMSRARETTHVHVVADGIAQAVEDLRAEWSTERRQRWVHDADRQLTANDRARPHLSRSPDPHLRAAVLAAERHALAQVAPPVAPDAAIQTRSQIARLEQRLGELRHGHGIDRQTPLGEAAHERTEARTRRATAEQVLRDPNLGWRTRRHWRSELGHAAQRGRQTRILQPVMTSGVD
jgi:conjugative relaxase-like TrwC/TraI family protein